MTVPGQKLREFTVSTPDPDGHESELGREMIGGFIEIGKIKAVLAQAKPEEVQRWKQLNHPVSHKIIMQGKPGFDVKPGDIFERSGRRFYNEMIPYDVGDLGHWTIYYCIERSDVV